MTAIDLLLVNAERRRLASHAHRTALRFLAGINTYCNSATDAELRLIALIRSTSKSDSA